MVLLHEKKTLKDVKQEFLGKICPFLPKNVSGWGVGVLLAGVG